MAITKKIIQKDAQGNVIEVDIGANATNITEDSKHRFVTDAEKESWSTKQNVFSNITVGSTTIAADNTTDTLTLVEGSNVTLTADAAGDKVTISATNTVYDHPDTPGNKHIPSGGGSGQILKWSANGTAYWADPYKQLEILGEYEITVGDWSKNYLYGYYMSGFPCYNVDYASHIFLEFVSQDLDVPGLDFASILAAKKAFDCVDYVKVYGTSEIRFYSFTERPAKAFKCKAWVIR